MKKILPLMALILMLGTSSISFALDPACEEVLKPSEARTNAPAWQSTTELRPGLTLEAMKVNGTFYKKMTGGTWNVSPVSIDQMDKQFATDARSGKLKMSDCKNAGSETFDGVDSNVITYQIEIGTAPAASGKLLIGKSNGLPIMQLTGASKVIYQYKNVPAPSL